MSYPLPASLLPTPVNGGRGRGSTFLARAASLEGFGREPFPADTPAPSPPSAPEERGPRRVRRRLLEALGEDARLQPPPWDPWYRERVGRGPERTTRTRRTPAEKGRGTRGVRGRVGMGRVAR